MEKRGVRSNLELLFIVSSIIAILGLFVLSNVITAVKSYQSGYTEGRQYVIASVELQKCEILKNNFKKGYNGKQTN